MWAKVREGFLNLMWRIGHRGAFLMFLAILDILYGYSLYVVPRKLQIYNLLLPWHVWAVMWLFSGIACLIGAFLKKDRMPFGIAATVKALWAAAFVNLAIHYHVPNAWISIVIWGCFSALVVTVSWWPEVRRKSPIDLGELDE